MRSITRRDFLQKTPLVAGLGLGGKLVLETKLPSTKVHAANNTKSDPKTISFGLVTDPHYADMPPKRNRYYRDSLAKMKQAVDSFNQRSLTFAVELGDFIDAGPSAQEDMEYLRRISDVSHQFEGDRHFVLGNHCVNSLTKQQLLYTCQAKTKTTYYSFDHGDFHFIVLDGNFRKDGVEYKPGNYHWDDTALPAKQIEWLKADLARAKEKVTSIFIHQNMDDDGAPRNLDNSAKVRKILEEAENVAVVFQGHCHKGRYRRIGGIHYCTLHPMVIGPSLKNNSYAIATLNREGVLKIESFGES